MERLWHSYELPVTVALLQANMTGTLTFLIVPYEKLVPDTVNTSQLSGTELVRSSGAPTAPPFDVS